MKLAKKKKKAASLSVKDAQRSARPKLTASNAKGERRVASISVTPQFYHDCTVRCHEGIATGKYQYQTPADVFRACLDRGYYELFVAGDGDTDGQAQPWHSLQLQMDDLEATRTQAQDLWTRLDSELASLLLIGQHTTAGTLLRSTVHRLDELPATSWRAWLFDQIRAKYLFLLDTERAAPLTAGAPSRDLLKT